MLSIPQVPGYIQDVPTSSTDEAAGTQVPKLQPTTSGRFLFKANDTEVDLGTSVEIVILAVTPPENYIRHRRYYKKEYDSENPKASSGPPDCASQYGVIPIKLIAKPQSSTCDKCPWAVLGSKGKGQLSKCEIFKEIYAVFPDKLEEVFQLKIPVTVLSALREYRGAIRNSGGKDIVGVYHQPPLAGMITRVSFDPSETKYAKMQFSPVKWLPEEALKITTELAVGNQVAQLTNTTQAALPAPPVTSAEPVTPVTSAEPVTPVTSAEPVTSAKPVTQTALEVLLPTAEPESPSDLLAFISPVEEVSAFDSIVQGLNQCATTADLGPFVRSPGVSAKLKEISAEELKTLNQLITQKQADLKSVLTATNPSELPGVLAGILTKANPQEHLNAFVELANKITGVIFDPAVHSVSANKFPALTKAGQYKKSRVSKSATEVATPPQGIDDLLANLDEV